MRNPSPGANEKSNTVAVKFTNKTMTAMLVRLLEIRIVASSFCGFPSKRTAALSLKLSEIELVKKIIKDKPILLLDDVLSELDSNRQNFLLNSIGDIQTIVTCTGLEEFINNRMNINKIFKVTDGHVVNEN